MDTRIGRIRLIFTDFLEDTNKKRAEVIVLYYHDIVLFSEKQLRDAYQSYLRNSKSKRIQQVYYIVDRKLYTLK